MHSKGKKALAIGVKTPRPILNFLIIESIVKSAFILATIINKKIA